MNNQIVRLVFLYALFKGVPAQAPLVFATTPTIPIPTPAPTPAPTTAAPKPTDRNTVCICVAPNTCVPASSAGGIDIRIVNPGNPCPAGLVQCCSSALVDLSTCGIRKIPATAQVQGQASFGAYPWQVALLMPNNAYFGSGVLYTNNIVLTAAHKVSNLKGGGFKVRLGEWDAQKVNEPYPYQEYMVRNVSIHPNFNPANLQNDIAVIRLNGVVPIASSPHINDICGPIPVPAAGVRCWTSGWGQNAFGNTGSYQSILKEVDVPILSQVDCETRLRSTRLGQFFILDKQSFFCAGGEAGKDACTGDGGSPLVCQGSNGQWQLVGLVAWGIGCASSGVPGVYVNVANYMGWILTQIVNI